jgi:hypothetical protein
VSSASVWAPGWAHAPGPFAGRRTTSTLSLDDVQSLHARDSSRCRGRGRDGRVSFALCYHPLCVPPAHRYGPGLSWVLGSFNALIP